MTTASAGAEFTTASAGAEFTTQSTGAEFATASAGAEFATGVETAGASFGIEGGDNEGTVGYGTSVIQGMSSGAEMTTSAIEGMNTETQFATESAGAFETTSSSVVGLPSVPSNELTSTVGAQYEGPYISPAN